MAVGKTIGDLYTTNHVTVIGTEKFEVETAAGLSGGLSTNDISDYALGKAKLEIVNDIVTGGATKFASAETVKTLNTNKAEKAMQVIAGNGTTGGGDLSANRTINIVSADDGITVNADNIQLAPVNSGTSTSATKALAAAYGKTLKDLVDAETTNRAANDATIVSDEKAMYPSISHYKRVLADSGSVIDKGLLISAFASYMNQLPETKLLFCPELGVKERTSGLNKFGVKMYGLDSANTDAVQAANVTQPYMTVNAAPNSRKGLKFLQGQTQTGLVDFTDVSFAATDSWTLTMRVKVNRKGGALLRFGSLYVNFSSSAVSLTQGSTVVLSATYTLDLGKSYTFEFQYSNGVGLIKKDNVALPTTTVSSSVTYQNIYIDVANYFDGTLYSLHLTNTRISESKSQLNHQFLSVIFPEIEGIAIGNQFWATENFEGTVDGAGNVIPNVTDNTAWANSTALYDAAYAAEPNALLKTYAGCKAAAMWCYYNNDPGLGAIYGKLYNWHAVYLIWLNPPRGWRVPSKADFDQLVAYEGGGTVAGGKLKAKFGGFDDGFASNESGMSAIPSGYRSQDGSFVQISAYSPLITTSQFIMTTSNNTAEASFSLVGFISPRGFPLRLLRNEPVGPNEASYSTGVFTTNIASGTANKDLTIPFGYRVSSVRVTSAVALTAFSCNLYSTALALQNNLLTGKAVDANVPISFRVTADQKILQTNPVLRFNATGNTAGDNIEITVVLEKDVLPIS